MRWVASRVNLGIRHDEGSVSSFGCFTLGEKALWTNWTGDLVGFGAGLGTLENKNLFPLPGMHTQSVSRATCSSVTIPTAISWVPSMDLFDVLYIFRSVVFYILVLTGVLAKLWKAIIDSSCLSVRRNKSAPTGWIFMKLIFHFFLNFYVCTLRLNTIEVHYSPTNAQVIVLKKKQY
jgi:hypothetical protein